MWFWILKMSRWEDCANFCFLSSSSCQAWSYVDESRLVKIIGGRSGCFLGNVLYTTAQKGLAQLCTSPGNTNFGCLKWNFLKWCEPCWVWKDDIFAIKHTSGHNYNSTNASNTDASSATNDTNTTNSTNKTNTTDKTNATNATNTSNEINTESSNSVGHRW